MAKRDWLALQQEYLSAFDSSGVTPKEWCEEKGLNYNSARRHIKRPSDTVKNSKKELRKTAQKSAHCAKPEDAQKAVEVLQDDLGLTAQQARFCLEYVIDNNATQAAIRAGYSEDSASQTGYKLCQKSSVQKAIKELQTASVQRQMITADRVLAEMAKIGFSNFQDFIDEYGKPVNLTTISRDTAAAIKEVKVKTVHVKDQDIEEVTYKLHDKRAALVDLGKYHNLFNPGAQQKNDDQDIENLSDEERRSLIQELKSDCYRLGGCVDQEAR